MSDPKKLVIGSIDPATKLLETDTMAFEIFDELVKQAPLAAGEDPVHRERFAIAVAAGVIRHLQKHGQAFHVDVSDSATAIDRRITVD
jgi:hypothetical protein